MARKYSSLGSVGQSRVAAGHLDVLMSQKLLETLEMHAGIEQLGGHGMAKAMDRVSLLGELCPREVLLEAGQRGAVRKGPVALP